MATDEEKKILMVSPSSETHINYMVSVTCLPERNRKSRSVDKGHYEHIIYQNDYVKKFIFNSIPYPSWKYKIPPPQLLVRGLTANSMHTIVCDINQLSIQICKDTDHKFIRFIPLFLVLFLVNGIVFILLSISDDINPGIIFIVIGSIQIFVGIVLVVLSVFYALHNRN